MQGDAPLTDFWKPRQPMQPTASTAEVNKKKPNVNSKTDKRNVTTVGNADMVSRPYQPSAKQPAPPTGKLAVTVVGQTILTLYVNTKKNQKTTRIAPHVPHKLTRKVAYLIHYAPPLLPAPPAKPLHWTTICTTTLTIVGSAKLPSLHRMFDSQPPFVPRIIQPSVSQHQPPAASPSTQWSWPTLGVKAV